ncbi:monocarboxylate transporter 14-like [Ostrinia furnacalis]|uniref:monocarboxylate transporter 14-like n=1 Tax=Ostrinia furnacalis TaxID=93504 RepID=UPI0010400B1D|nr:monocarboxylate transporter 14-like [Ostrinia furnacalis]XP_028160180.1 monocarboxylate transporter 14-like [Ostrinia furnacalis]
MADLSEDKPNNNQNGNNTTLPSDIDEDINKINSLKSKSKEIVAHYEKTNGTPNSPPVERVKFQGLTESDFDSDSSDESESFVAKLPPVPDGGWGWVVVISAFLVSACADGLSFSYGLLQEEFARYFDTTQSQVSMIGSLFIATPLLAGPIMSALVDRYGCRWMTMIAGLLSTISFLLASVCNSIEMLCLTFGFMSGLAMGILYVTAVVSVAFWFDKKRNLAVSLASSGIGFGTLIYSPMTHYFLQVYDWRNTVVLLAGTLLNMCVCGALMRTPEWLEIKQKRERRLSRSRRSSSAGSLSSRSLGGESLFLTNDELKSLLKSGKSPEYILETLATSIAEAEQLENTTQMNAEATLRQRMHSAIHLPTFIQQNERVPPEVIDKLMKNNRLYNIILQNYPDILTRRHSEINLNVEAPPADAVTEPAKLPVQVKIKKPKDITESDVNKSSEKIVEHEGEHKKTKDASKSTVNDTKQTPRAKEHSPKKEVRGQSSSWLVRQLSTDHHYFKDMPLYRNTIMYRGTMMNIPRYRLKASSLPDIYKNSMWSIESESDDEWRWYHRLFEVLKKSFNFEMFTEFHFFMFNLSELILSVWFIVPYFFLKSYMTSQNMEGGEVMISIIGIASAIGIVVLGWSGDQKWLNVTKTFSFFLILCGASVAAYPFFIHNYWLLSINSAVFGFSFASSYSYSPAILMKLIPLEHFTVAYGLILLAQGIGHLVGPPLGGLLYDVTGSWELTFYVGGLWVAVSGLCLVVIACTNNRRFCGRKPLLNDAQATTEV